MDGYFPTNSTEAKQGCDQFRRKLQGGTGEEGLDLALPTVDAKSKAKEGPEANAKITAKWQNVLCMPKVSDSGPKAAGK